MASENLNLERYQRQLALPEISITDQQRLSETHLLIVGAGGLGSAALPYLAAAGIGHITIYDHDSVSISNLHRQTLYKDAQDGQNKAELAAAYARDLNPDIEIIAKTEKITTETKIESFDLILDGSDNFETKTMLNQISIDTKTPLISASVNQWAGQIGIFAGYAKNAPCYHCLFPKLPADARNCNEAGILGTSAGICGMYQAHLTLCLLLGIGDCRPGTLLTFDFKTFRIQNLNVNKDPSCPHCKNATEEFTPNKKETKMVELISMAELAKKDHIIVDVRTTEEITADPINNALHMELTTIPSHYEELPKDKLLAFVCAGNIRSAQAAEYLGAMGYKTCVLDKFSL